MGGYLETVRVGSRVLSLTEGAEQSSGVVTRSNEFDPYVSVMLDNARDVDPQRVPFDQLKPVDFVEFDVASFTVDDELDRVACVLYSFLSPTVCCVC